MKLSSNALKWIAMAAMLTDHIGLVLFEYLYVYKGPLLGYCTLLQTPWENVVGIVGYTMRVVGRISFPLYCFLLTEGFLHTRSWRKYWLRLMAFALISEIPFSLAVFDMWVGSVRNVFFELATGILMLQGFRMAQRYYDLRRNVWMLLVFCAASAAAWLGQMDDGVEGMVLIVVFYFLREHRAARAGAGGLVAFTGSWESCFGSGALSAVFLLLYSGEKGGQGNKYLFYCFYPLHLLVLFLIRRYALGIM